MIRLPILLEGKFWKRLVPTCRREHLSWLGVTCTQFLVVAVNRFTSITTSSSRFARGALAPVAHRSREPLPGDRFCKWKISRAAFEEALIGRWRGDKCKRDLLSAEARFMVEANYLTSV